MYYYHRNCPLLDGRISNVVKPLSTFEAPQIDQELKRFFGADANGAEPARSVEEEALHSGNG